MACWRFRQVGMAHDSVLSLDTTPYPAWVNHPCASWLVAGCEYFGNGLFQGCQCPGRLCPHERLDLGPPYFDRGQGGRIRRPGEQSDANGGTGVRDACPLMGCEMSHEEDLAGPELRHRIPGTGMRLKKLRTRLQNPLPLGLRWLKADQCDRLCIPWYRRRWAAGW